MGIAISEQSVVDRVPKNLYIDGRWRASSTGRSLAVEDPATGETLCLIADADSVDAQAAMDAAVAAQADWASWAPRERGDLLRAAYDELRRRGEELALLMTLEMGKPLAEARAEVRYGAEFLRWFSEEAVRVSGRYAVAPDGRARMIISRQPVGPVLLITPWNFPLAMGTRKIGPAIAAGCTMVVKPSRQTPLTTMALTRLFADLGLPAGVLNVIVTSSSGEMVGDLLEHPGLRKLSFTGSTEVGRTLMAQASTRLLRLSMELGGNAPFIVFEDADLEQAVEGAVVAKMRNGGEACTAANRFYVADALREEFATRLAARLAEMKVGRGTAKGVEVGPLIDAAQRLKVEQLVQDAVDRGARALTGATPVNGRGHFVAPTVLDDVDRDARVLSEEIFGPVAPVVGFGSEDDAVDAANATEHGLVAYVYTRDLERALRLMERLETGMVGINQGLVSNPAAPFGGIKASGFGREGGVEGLDEYLEIKYAAVPIT